MREPSEKDLPLVPHQTWPFGGRYRNQGGKEVQNKKEVGFRVPGGEQKISDRAGRVGSHDRSRDQTVSVLNNHFLLLTHTIKGLRASSSSVISLEFY